MSVEREDAVKGEQLILRIEINFDRLNTGVDPSSFSDLTITDSNDVVLQTIASADIIRDSKGKYHVVTLASWNTLARSVSDNWTFIHDGITYEISLGTTIFDSTSPGVGMASFIALVKRKVKAPTIGLDVLSDPGDYEEFITEALLEYSRRRPYAQTVKLTGDGTFFFSLPSDWNEEISFIREIEYQIDRSPQSIIQYKKYQVVQLDTGYKGKFIGEYYPGLDEFFYLRYTSPHIITASSNTINTIHKRSFVNLCASITCMAVATKYGHTADSSNEADAIDYRSKGDEFAARSREYLKMFDKIVKPVVTGVRGELDIQMFWKGNKNGLNRDNSMI